MRDVEKLVSELTRESSIRKREIDELAVVLRVETVERPPASGGPARQHTREWQNSEQQPSVATKRAFYLMLYSHFEGFVKASVGAYLEELGYVDSATVEVSPNLYRSCVIQHAAELKVRVDNCDGAEETLDQIVDGSPLMIPQVDRKLPIPVRLIEDLSDARSNMSYERLTQMLRQIDVDVPPSMRLKRKMIEDLLSMRNGIAHGDRGVRFRELPGKGSWGLPSIYQMVRDALTEVSASIVRKADETFSEIPARATPVT